MSGSPLNKEVRLHRLFNQRRIAASLIDQAKTLLVPGTPFARELSKLFAKSGWFGSKDRRLYRDLIYAYLRYQPWLKSLSPDAERMMDALINLAQPTREVESLYPTLNEPISRAPSLSQALYTIGKSVENLGELLPDWFESHIESALTTDELENLFSRPPLWLRIQSGDANQILKEANALKRDARDVVDIHPTIPHCLRAPHDFPLADFRPYARGQVEVQDISSQILLQLIESKPEGKWLDACAGAGGKSLQLAGILGESGTVTAYDPRQNALEILVKRAAKAGIRSIKTVSHLPNDRQFNGVLVDAPCSGSGTWRRHPFLMRQISEDDVMAFSNQQLSLLQLYAERVETRGLLAYCTCSLSRFENEHVADAFLKSSKGVFEPAPLKSAFGLARIPGNHGITVPPIAFDGDGLYIACFRRVHP